MVRPSASVGASSGNAAARRDGLAVTFAGWPAVLGVLSARGDLSSDQARTAMSEILEGAASPAQIAGFIVALRMKGETVDELTGLLQAMLDAAERVELPTGTPVVDVVGTGGDRAHTINVSTLSALVVAGAGGRVCKHGNRAASSSAGSADVLEALGVRIDCGPDDVARCVAQAGIGFCFAPRYHPAMRHAGPTRRELGIPTVFNILGPLANPAGARHLMIGVADGTMAERMVGVLAARGAGAGADRARRRRPRRAHHLDHIARGRAARRRCPQLRGRPDGARDRAGAGRVGGRRRSGHQRRRWPAGCSTESTGRTATS